MVGQISAAAHREGYGGANTKLQHMRTLGQSNLSAGTAPHGEEPKQEQVFWQDLCPVCVTPSRAACS